MQKIKSKFKGKYWTMEIIKGLERGRRKAGDYK